MFFFNRSINSSIFILFACMLLSFEAQAMRVGVGKAEITPTKPMRLYGYSSRKDPYIGIYDPLFCRALVFDDGERKAAIVSFDSGTIPLGHWLDTIRQRVKERYGIGYVLLTATHSHAAPWLGKQDDPIPWNKMIVEKMHEAIEDALAAMQPASFTFGVGEIDITYDRRVVNEDGRVTMLWQNHERKFTKAVDQTIKVLQIRNEKKEPITTLVHYACHPVISGNKNNRVTAELPGVVCRYVDEALGGETIFVQGACGDINPYLAGYLQADTAAYKTFVEEGEKVGKKVVEIVEKAHPVNAENLRIRHQTQTVSFGLRHPLEDERMQDRLQGYYSEEGFKEFLKSDLKLEADVSILALDDTFAWVGFPGEFFDDFQVDLANRSPIEHTFFVGYCNGNHSYFPTIEAAAEGGYGADYGLLAEVGTGERMVDRAIIGLYQILGEL
ncbi:hypothetical protein GF373_00835 [bacterium]|nr:hypothetical protein [bacterium]